MEIMIISPEYEQMQNGVRECVLECIPPQDTPSVNHPTPDPSLQVTGECKPLPPNEPKISPQTKTPVTRLFSQAIIKWIAIVAILIVALPVIAIIALLDKSFKAPKRVQRGMTDDRY